MNKKTTNHQRGLLTLCCAFLFYGLAFAQSTDLQVIATDGGYATSPQLSMSWTVGQISTSTESGGAFIATQGFQQSFPLLLALPVELLDFSARKIDKTVELSWQTASERNNAGFAIERSDNSGSWEQIGYVEGNGTSNVFLDYAFVDLEPFMGNNYYRLRQIDLDGQFDYSPVRHVIFTETAATILSVYPNPNNGRFTLSINNPAGERAVVEVFTSTGNLVWEQNFARDEMPEFWKKDFHLDQWQLYYVVSRVGKAVATQKVVVIGDK
jgi:hypothetical protein